MNYDTVNNILWPHEEIPTKVIFCENCNGTLNDFESEDPIKINGHIYCDNCASEAIQLRFQMRPVREMVRELKDRLNYGHMFSNLLDS